ncbi:MAG: SH3 domain-containing protein [Treponema sp.]|uniref:SH3 domain-containing protein n=1 Tax=Treponema sp. TaxID=166 RepID=UPI00298E7D43|nr:SH3 domain-containing protein [Treponema sp.]MBR5932747.1 SH3 domain-containing protein [Treponema sp.]
MMKKLTVAAAMLLSLASLAFAGGGSSGYVLRNPSWIYAREGDNLKYKGSLDIGTSIDIFSDVFTPAKVGNSVNDWGGQYIEIYYEGEEYYTDVRFVVNQGDAGERYVITEDTPVFTVGSVGAIEAKPIPAGTVVIECTTGSYDDLLQAVYYFDSAIFGRIRKAYVLRRILSNNSSDYDAVCLVNSAMEMDLNKSRDEIVLLFSQAESAASSSGIREFVLNKKSQKFGTDISNSPVESYSASGVIDSDGSNVNVREKPGKSSKIVGKLTDGAHFMATERTTKKDKIGKEEDYWYHITTPGEDSIDGWIFGSTANIE